jgi:hypothetical protein
MRIQDFPDTDTIYIDLVDTPGADVVEVAPESWSIRMRMAEQ